MGLNANSEKPKIILMNKMCTGSYNANNIGHEIINYFRPDKEQSNDIDFDKNCTYIYINPLGGMAKKYNNKIDTILLTSEVQNGKVEILAILYVDKEDQIHISGEKGVERLEESGIKKVDENWKKNINRKGYAKLKYGGVEVNQIFKDNENKVNNPTYVTFKVKNKNMYKPKDFHRMYISYDGSENDSDTVVRIETKKLAKSSLKEYFIDEEKEIEGKQCNDYQKIKKFIEKAKRKGYLETFITTEVEKNNNIGKNMLEIMDKVNDEQIYTNLLAYWFSRGELFNKFIIENKCYSEIKEDNYEIMKEKKVGANRADIIAIGKENVIVIENKILSSLNSVTSKENNKSKNRNQKNEDEKNAQLGKMLKYIEKVVEINKKEEKDKENSKQKEKRIGKDNKEVSKKDKKMYKYKQVYGMIFVPEYNKKRIEDELTKYEGYKIDKKEERERYYKIITYKELLEFFKKQEKNEFISKDLYKDYYREFLNFLENQKYETINERNRYQIERKFMSAIQVNLNKNK